MKLMKLMKPFASRVYVYIRFPVHVTHPSLPIALQMDPADAPKLMHLLTVCGIAQMLPCKLVTFDGENPSKQENKIQWKRQEHYGTLKWNLAARGIVPSVLWWRFVIAVLAGRWHRTQGRERAAARGLLVPALLRGAPRQPWYS